MFLFKNLKTHHMKNTLRQLKVASEYKRKKIYFKNCAKEEVFNYKSYFTCKYFI